MISSRCLLRQGAVEICAFAGKAVAE